MNRVTPMPLRQKEPTLRGTSIERRYFIWMHAKTSCIGTLQWPIEVAHTGGLQEGKGMGRKAHLWTCIPLIRALHLEEEKNRPLFWERIGYPDHLTWAERLYDIFEADDDPSALIWDMHEGANHDYVREVLLKYQF